MTFREAVMRVLADALDPLNPDEIAQEINSRGLYRRRDGTPIDGRYVMWGVEYYLSRDFEVLIGLKKGRQGLS